MKFTLKPYQRAALEDMLSALERAQGVYERESVPSSVSLSATTGAGKTVIASAVIESLFYGNDDFDYEADDGALVAGRAPRDTQTDGGGFGVGLLC